MLTRQASREVDRLATEEFAMPSLLLMENAAAQLADAVLDAAGDLHSPRVLILCGPGNNGGDGLAAARHLHNAGAVVALALTAGPDEYRGDAAINLTIVSRMDLPMHDARAGVSRLREVLREHGNPDVVVDALLGTGQTCAPRPPIADLVVWIDDLRRAGAVVVAADVPTGLDADTGQPLGRAVHADVTVTFVGIKKGFLTLSAQEYVGDVVVADIGVPRELVQRLGERLDVASLGTRGETQRASVRVAAQAGRRRRGERAEPADS